MPEVVGLFAVCNTSLKAVFCQAFGVQFPLGVTSSQTLWSSCSLTDTALKSSRIKCQHTKV